MRTQAPSSILAASVNVIDVIGHQALAEAESPFGAVGVVHSGVDLDAWWIWKDHEDIERTFAVMDREDLCEPCLFLAVAPSGARFTRL